MPDQNKPTFKIAAVQATPVFLDRAATVEKVCELIAVAGGEGARLIIFPEAFIPAYPDWVWVIPSSEEEVLNELYAQLLENAVTIPSETTKRLCHAAKLANAYVVMGMSERNTLPQPGIVSFYPSFCRFCKTMLPFSPAKLCFPPFVKK